MVSATGLEGDGIVRTTQYATFREDKPASPGYSQELMSNRINPNYYDNLLDQPKDLPKELDTILKFFQSNVKESPDAPFLGSRKPTGQIDDKGKPIFGEYLWKSNKEVDNLAQSLAKGLM